MIIDVTFILTNNAFRHVAEGAALTYSSVVNVSHDVIQKVDERCEKRVGHQEIALAFLTLQKLRRQKGLGPEPPASDGQERRFEVYG